jgi:hypothetical protein
MYRDAGVTAEAHVLAKGGHGFNMGQRSTLIAVHTWPQRLVDWLEDSGILGLQQGPTSAGPTERQPN